MAMVEEKSRKSLPTRVDRDEETAFLNAIPWRLDAHLQSAEILRRTLHSEASRFEELPYQPTFSLVAVLRDPQPEHLHELILSCRCQSYRQWQLVLIDDASQSQAHLEIADFWARKDCRILLERLSTPLGPSGAKNLAITKVTGDFLVVIDGDGVLHPMALGIFARQLSHNPAVNFIFANEAEIDARSKRLSTFLQKPPLDLFTLLRINYVGRLFAVKRDMLERATRGEPAFRAEFDGIEEHDFLLRLALCDSTESQHVPLNVYYRRARSGRLARLTENELAEKRTKLLKEHAPRVYPGATWTARVSGDPDPLASSSLWITDLPRDEKPRLLVVIPFKDQVETTIQCLESIERQEHQLDVRVALVNNRSIEPETLTRLNEWISQPRTTNHLIVNYDCAFNFARLNNTAIRQFGEDRELILFLNNDVVLTTPQCLQVMSMTLLSDPRAGMLGIKLHYGDECEIQHGGILFTKDICGPSYDRISHARSASEFVDAERISLGVTFACAMTVRNTYEQLGGLEEVLVPNSFGDLDMCLRALEAGFRNYYLGSLTGIHYESISRGLVDEDLEYSVLYDRHGQTIASWRQRYLHHSGLWVSRLPLRYRLVDKAVGAVKAGLGSHYGAVKSAISKMGKLTRRLKSPGSLYAALRMIVKPLPLVGPAGSWTVRGLRRFARGGAAARQIVCQLLRDPSGLRRLAVACRGGRDAFFEELALQVPTLQLDAYLAASDYWRSRPTPEELGRLRERTWPEDAPRFTIVMPVYNIREDWLRLAIESVLAQTYPHWELVCVNDASPAPHIKMVLDEMARRDDRIRVLHCPKNRGVSVATNLGIELARGDYIGFMDHDDALEPHALHHFASAVLRDRPDMLYSDEAVTGASLDTVLRIDARPAFSYDHYLGHPYLVHLIAARAELVREVGGLNEEMVISQDVDLNLRLIEVCRTICHVPEVLYRWRTHPGSLGHQKMHECRMMTRQAMQRHFARTGQSVRFEDETHFNYRDVQFQHQAPSRVAILIASPGSFTKLSASLASLERTVDPAVADVFLIERRDEHADSAQELSHHGQRCRVLCLKDAVQLSAMLNAGAAAVQGSYTHYLFLGHEVEATQPGWLDHLLSYGQRPDVAGVGALLLGRGQVVRHAGFVVEPTGNARHALRGHSLRHWIAGRNPGPCGALLAGRDVTAVSAACLLTPVEIFDRLGGFDEHLATVLYDVDYCLRAAALGYKIIHDPYAVLWDRSDETRGVGADPKEDSDVRFFRDRHRKFLEREDPFSWSTITPKRRSIGGRDATADDVLKPRTMRVALPPPSAAVKTSATQVNGTLALARGPHRRFTSVDKEARTRS